MKALTTLLKNTENLAKEVVAFDRDNTKKMGLYDTGRASKSMKYKISYNGSDIIVTFRVKDYFAKFNKRSKPGKVNIANLIKWAKRKHPGKSRKELDRFIFLTMRKWRSEGMPTFASRKYSRTGKRIGWIDDGSQFLDSILDEELGVDQYVNSLVDDALLQLA